MGLKGHHDGTKKKRARKLRARNRASEPSQLRKAMAIYRSLDHSNITVEAVDGPAKCVDVYEDL